MYGFYAGNDARIGATVPATTDAMKELKKVYNLFIYEGAGHGFMRAGEAPPPDSPAATGNADADRTAMEAYRKNLTNYSANKIARDQAWVSWKAILAKL